MKKYTYWILAFICFVGWIVLDNLYSQLKWIALGIGIVMVICAFLPGPKTSNLKGRKEARANADVYEDEAELIGKSKEMSKEEIEMNLAMDGDSYPQIVG